MTEEQNTPDTDSDLLDGDACLKILQNRYKDIVILAANAETDATLRVWHGSVHGVLGLLSLAHTGLTRAALKSAE